MHVKSRLGAGSLASLALISCTFFAARAAAAASKPSSTVLPAHEDTSTNQPAIVILIPIPWCAAPQEEEEVLPGWRGEVYAAPKAKVWGMHARGLTWAHEHGYI